MDVDHSKLGNKISKRSWSERFCEEIYSLVLGRNRHEVNKFGLNFLTYQVAIQFDVFGSFMEDWICCYVKSRLTITVKNYLTCERNAKIM